VTNEDDLRAFAAAWLQRRDGLAGGRYVDALHEMGRSNEALAVCRELWDLGYVIGLTEAAWIAHDRGDFEAALASMTSALDHLDGDERLEAVGVVGCWRWHHFNDLAAEPLLRQGMRHYGSAWADLGKLLRATGRIDEGEEVLRAGAAADVYGVRAAASECPLASRRTRGVRTPLSARV
jgi:hypothetical protein